MNLKVVIGDGSDGFKDFKQLLDQFMKTQKAIKDSEGFVGLEGGAEQALELAFELSQEVPEVNTLADELNRFLVKHPEALGKILVAMLYGLSD